MSTRPPTRSSGSGDPYRNRSRPSATDRPLGVTIICVLGFIGFLVAFVPILQLLGVGGIGALLAFVFLVLNFAVLFVLIGLLNMQSWALTWALILYGLDAVLSLFTFNVIGLVIALVIVAYLLSISDQFE